jgi:hypothetical protein
VSKFSIVYVKQHPVMFGAIFLVFGLFLWIMLNRGAAGGSVSTTVTTPQPSDAAIAAGVQLQMGQLEASTQVAMGQLSLAANQQNNQAQSDLAAMALQAQVLQIQSDHDIANSQIEASLGALSLQLGNNLAITHDNNQFMIDYARNAQDAANTSLLINANLQQVLSAQQLEAFKFGTMASVIPTLKKGKRDNAFALLGASSGGSVSATDAAMIMGPNGGGGGGGLFSSILHVAVPVTNLIH